MARTFSSNIVNAMENGTFFVEDETPVGTIDGSNTDFTLADAPNPPASLEVRRNGMVITLTEDYTLSSDALTFITAPPTGSILRVDYQLKPA